jgi:hypothetical protein
MNELTAFVQVKTSSEMQVDVSNNAGTLKINIDMTFDHIPCNILSVNAQDIMGTHSINIEGTIIKRRLDKNGNIISFYLENHAFPTHDEVKEGVIAGEGCQLFGNIEVLRVPGNFYVSSHQYGEIITQLISEGLLKYNLSHKINHISFGDESHIKHIIANFNAGILNPIDGVHKIQEKGSNLAYEYYLKVVPSTYVDVEGNVFNVHQFTSNDNQQVSEMFIPNIYFRYDISPILVRIVQYKQQFFHFFIQICAIIGGIYTVTGIVDTLLNRLFSKSKSD